MTPQEQLELYRQKHRIQVVRIDRQDHCAHDKLPIRNTTHLRVHDEAAIHALTAQVDGAGFPQKGV